MPNRLIAATSPYLLQHAHNPVDWQEWGPAALAEARENDKPILVSIGYAACHWCHVMERESFERADIAALMNTHFVCIKVDREERSDIDQLYMEAVQAMGLHGGWPLNVFLTPDQKPFYGGTYFPPQQWQQLLGQVAQTFTSRRAEINQSADELALHLQTTDLKRFAGEDRNDVFERTKLDELFARLEERIDRVWGGLDKAPKFVMPSVWCWLLRYHFISGNEEARAHVLHTLRQMTRAGLYDQLGGGFARYSVDSEWFAPHFEKMLYDNGQLLSLYAEAYALTKDPQWKTIVDETTDWLSREMMDPEGGFFSALDADSEGEEGKYYTWTAAELAAALGPDQAEAMTAFGCDSNGNWEHGQNILFRPDEALLATPRMAHLKEKMNSFRVQKPRPALDDKVVTGWNAIVIQGLTDCYKAFGDERFLNLALKNIQFIETHLRRDGKICRAFKTKASATEGFLEDYAFLIQAYTALYQVTFQETYLQLAAHWTTYTIDHFFDAVENYFFLSSRDAEQLIARKKEIFDNVIPSSNSVMARNLFHLSILLDRQDWKDLAISMTARLAAIITTEPVYMSNWAMLYTEIVHGMSEVVISGVRCEALRRELHENYLPFALTLGASADSTLPLFEGRAAAADETKIYVCRQKVCQLPVVRVSDALVQLNVK